MAALVAALAGCASTVSLEPAPLSNTPECANMIVRLPETLDGLDKRTVNAQATAAYGDPVAVIVRCGLPLPAPSALPCVNVDGVDWLREDAHDPTFRFLTYGLDPATEVIVDSTVASGAAALRQLAPAVGSQSAPVQACVGPVDGAR